MLEISEGLHEGEQVVLNPVPSEVEEDITDETLLDLRGPAPTSRPSRRLPSCPQHEVAHVSSAVAPG